MIVDSHCHASDRWYEPLESLVHQMDRNGVDAAVLVQMLGTFDFTYMLDAARKHPGRFAVVAGVRSEREDACGLLAKHAHLLGGIRLRPSSRSTGNDPLAIWRCAAEHGLAVSCVGPAADVTSAAFRQIADELPDLTIVLEHLAGLARPDVGDRTRFIEPVLGLAELPNIHVKLPGLGQLAQRAADLDTCSGIPLDLEDVPAILDRLVDRFGAERVMWGSDFPPVASREGYANALAWPRALLAHRPAADLESMFGGVARRIFFNVE
jgi:L-fuconolactonase